MPRIAIIGTEGAGKTVFVTVLAHRMSNSRRVGLFLEPDARTFKDIEINWHALNHRVWPQSTPQGRNKFELRWKLRRSGLADHELGELRVMDVAGQDVRPIFADDAVSQDDQLPDEQRRIAEYCRTADAVVFVVNLNDYIEREGNTDHIDNETILKSAMDFLRRHGRTYCLVLTQADVYGDYARTEGSWEAVAAKHLRSVAGTHLATGVPWFPVASVNATEVVVEAEEVHLVPTPGFDSTGLEPFVAWLDMVATSQPSSTELLAIKAARVAKLRSPALYRWPFYAALGLGWLIFAATCSKTVPGGWFYPDTTEFDPSSIGIALFSFLFVWGALSGARKLFKGIR